MRSARSGRAPRRSMKEREANNESRIVFRQQFYKTEMCRFYQSGCVKGDKCCFAHGEGDLQVAPDLTKTSLCQDWVDRRCPLAAEDCQFAHGWGDIRATPAFVEYGSRQSKKAAARGSSEPESEADRPPAAPKARHAPKSSATRRAAASGAAKPEQMATDVASASPGGSSYRTDEPMAAAAPISRDASFNMEPLEQQPNAQANAPAAIQVAFVLQPWAALPGEVPMLPLQLAAAAGMAQQGVGHRIPDNRAMEVLLRQAMPDHYDD